MSSVGQKQANKNDITLAGSTKLVSEFFYFSINTILYQRGVYAPEKFRKTKKYNVQMQVADDPELGNYIETIVKQFKSWLSQGMIERLALVVYDLETSEPVERWLFSIDNENVSEDNGGNGGKSEATVKAEIQALFRQIVSCVSFLPELEGELCFDIDIYTKVDAAVPADWEETTPTDVANAEVVRLRSFSTNFHKVAGSVSYRAL